MNPILLTGIWIVAFATMLYAYWFSFKYDFILLLASAIVTAMCLAFAMIYYHNLALIMVATQGVTLITAQIVKHRWSA